MKPTELTLVCRFPDSNEHITFVSLSGKQNGLYDDGRQKKTNQEVESIDSRKLETKVKQKKIKSYFITKDTLERKITGYPGNKTL